MKSHADAYCGCNAPCFPKPRWARVKRNNYTVLLAFTRYVSYNNIYLVKIQLNSVITIKNDRAPTVQAHEQLVLWCLRSRNIVSQVASAEGAVRSIWGFWKPQNLETLKITKIPETRHINQLCFCLPQIYNKKSAFFLFPTFTEFINQFMHPLRHASHIYESVVSDMTLIHSKLKGWFYCLAQSTISTTQGSE